ncbi:MAG: hypothetical protein HFE76_04805 [Firmicutes bacterium]|nr:hypothetical protein [Bacillota bacterium]
MLNEEKLMGVLYEIRDEVKEVKQRVTNVESEMKDMRSEIRVLQTEVKELRADVDWLKVEVKELRADVDWLKVQVKDLRTDQDSQSAEVKNLYAITSELREQIEKHEKKIDRNFVMLERDLGGAMSGMTWLKENKVDKVALRKASI